MPQIPSQKPRFSATKKPPSQGDFSQHRSSPNWYVFRQRKEQGPYTESEIGELILAREVKGYDLVWTFGMSEWENAENIFALEKFFSKLPPRKTQSFKPRLKPYRLVVFIAFTVVVIFLLLDVRRQINQEKEHVSSVFFMELEKYRPWLESKTNGYTDDNCLSPIGHVTPFEERYENDILQNLNKVFVQKPFEVELLGFGFEVTVTVPDTVNGVQCLYSRAHGQHCEPDDLIQAVFPGPEHSNLRDRFFLAALVAESGERPLHEQLLAHLIAEGHIQTSFDRCTACESFQAFEKDFGCRMVKVSAEAEHLFTQAYDKARAYELGSRSRSEIERSLLQNFNHRILKLPKAFQNQVREAIRSDSAVVETSTKSTIDTVLGAVEVSRSTHKPNPKFVEQTLKQITTEFKFRPSDKPWIEKYPVLTNCRDTRTGVSQNTMNHCSSIKVVLPEGSDYLVVIKNEAGSIVNHGYVKESSTQTFSVNNKHTYETFFISGNGWNPAEPVPCNSCDNLFGYFNDANITKSGKEYLRNQELTYTLIPRLSGNFRPRPSTIEEVL